MKLNLTTSLVLSSLLFVMPVAHATTTDDSSSSSSSAVSSESSGTTDKIVASTPEEDAKITSTLNNLIKNSKTLSGLPVQASTTNGVVTYTGTVDSDSEASMLIETAESIIGVDDVDTSNLKVKDSQQPFTDMVITAKIKGLFIREDLFGEKDIASMSTSVETQNGVVYITGIVDNKQQIQNAINIIKTSVPGVKKVVYNVKNSLPPEQATN